MCSLADGEDVPFCDLHAILTVEFMREPELIDKVISPDGVHLTAEGRLMAETQLVPVLPSLHAAA